MLFILFQIGVGIVVGVMLIEYIYKDKYKKANNIPGPKPWPVLGNIFDFTPHDILNQLTEMHNKYGRIIKLRLGYEPIACVLSDPKHVEILLSSQKFIRKADDYNDLRPWLGDGLLTSTGGKWKKHRRMLTPAFHFKILEQFIDVFNSCGNIMIEKLVKEVENSEVFDIYPYITMCALDVICESVMGTPINAQNNSNSEYVQAVYKMCHFCHQKNFSLWRHKEYLYWFSSEYNEYKRCLKILHDTTSNIIKSRKELVENKRGNFNQKDDLPGKKKKMAFLDVLLTSTVDGKPLSDVSIREEVDTFMFEGHDTTASAMSFTLYLLANNPEAQKKVVDELDQIFGADHARQATYQDANEMKYLELVIKESLRMYPSVPLFWRSLDDEMDFGDGYVIPKNCYVVVFAYNLHRNPDIFPEPEKFIPERFLEPDRHPFVYVPFSAGPRNCIGQKFALLEMKILLSKVLRNYELLSAGVENEPIITPKLVLKSDNGMRIKIKPRK